MSNIQVLDRNTANRIAAGEVVERPASVIKELVENAIDAGATAITVEAREAGVKYMRVTDNGRGIRAEEVRVAFERHATSKLRSGDPLTDIRTMGFRGEALPSIAAVAKVEMLTRQAGALSGMRISVEGGEVCDVREAGCPEGTTVIVRDLFFNTPARLRFLKRAQTETAALCEAVAQQALSHPGVSFRMIMNARQLYHTAGDGDLRHLAALVSDVKHPDALLELCAIGAVGVRGLLGVGDNARATRAGEVFFVNGRVVHNRLLSAWVEEGCRESVMAGRYPYCAVFIDMPPGSVDVNVHPNKLEVRFTNEEVVRDTLMLAVREATSRDMRGIGAVAAPPRIQQSAVHRDEPIAAVGMPSEPLPRITPDVPQYTKPIAMRESYAFAPRAAAASSLDTAAPGSTAPAALPQQMAVETPQPTGDNVKKHTVIGQLFDLYLLVHDDNALYIIDQHAAHERILYDRMTATEQRVASQLLLTPFLLDLSMKERALVDEHETLLAELGYELSAFGASTLRVSAVPLILGEASGRALLMDIIGMLESRRRVTSAELMRQQLISLACKHAVKDGDRLDGAQIEYILQAMLTEDIPLTCPHGRPIIRKFTKAELEKLFKR